MKKFLRTLLFCGWTCAASAQSPLADSLMKRCDLETDARKRIDLLLKINDLSASAAEDGYARRLLDEAQAVGDPFAAGSSLGTLASCLIGASGMQDSLMRILDGVEPLLRGSSMEGLPAYYRMVALARRIQTADTEESLRLCRNYLDSVGKVPPGDIYERAARLFLKGVAAYKLVSADGRMQMERGLPYWNDELQLLPQMRPTARRNFHANLLTCLIAAYGSQRDQESLITVADDYLGMLDEYYRDPEIVSRRPYIDREMPYLVCYYTLCTSQIIDRERAKDYYDRYRRFRTSASNAPGNILTDKSGFYSISSAHYSRCGDYANALAYTDSLILLTRQGGRSSLVAELYASRAGFLEHLGRFREACGVYKEMLSLRDSLASHQYVEKVGELEVRYGLDKAERDRALLLAQKRQNTLYFVAVILLLAVAAIVYLWRSLRRIERLQRELAAESERAQESDRLKRDFMGSMSHEIRTPLNAINGFAELIAEGGFGPEESAEFAGIIRENTRQFTSLINDMMEVAQLDNTSAELPRLPMDICGIIRTEVGHLPEKDGVEYRMVFVEPEVIVPLHRGYVSMLIRELLQNAVKFTAAGSITVECGSIGNGRLSFAVSDTGCGVTPGMEEKIFERFYKEDSFGRGLGLGLSLCRLIAVKSGGDICLDTSYTRGARFIVTLPAE